MKSRLIGRKILTMKKKVKYILKVLDQRNIDAILYIHHELLQHKSYVNNFHVVFRAYRPLLAYLMPKLIYQWWSDYIRYKNLSSQSVETDKKFLVSNRDDWPIVVTLIATTTPNPNVPRKRVTFHIYQPLRSGRIWHKVNF